MLTCDGCNKEHRAGPLVCSTCAVESARMHEQATVERIVAWLRREADRMQGCERTRHAATYWLVSDAIERGDWKEKP